MSCRERHDVVAQSKSLAVMGEGLLGEFAKLVGDRSGEIPTRPTRKHYEMQVASEADETPENIRGLKSTRCTAWSRGCYS